MSAIVIKGVTHELVYDVAVQYCCNICSLRKECDKVEEDEHSLLCTILETAEDRIGCRYFKIKEIV